MARHPLTLLKPAELPGFVACVDMLREACTDDARPIDIFGRFQELAEIASGLILAYAEQQPVQAGHGLSAEEIAAFRQSRAAPQNRGTGPAAPSLPKMGEQTKPRAKSFKPPPRPGDPSPWTSDRISLLDRGYLEGRPRAEILKGVNALPGPLPVASLDAMAQKAMKLGFTKRPENKATQAQVRIGGAIAAGTAQERKVSTVRSSDGAPASHPEIGIPRQRAHEDVRGSDTPEGVGDLRAPMVMMTTEGEPGADQSDGVQAADTVCSTDGAGPGEGESPTLSTTQEPQIPAVLQPVSPPSSTTPIVRANAPIPDEDRADARRMILVEGKGALDLVDEFGWDAGLAQDFAAEVREQARGAIA